MLGYYSPAVHGFEPESPAELWHQWQDFECRHNYNYLAAWRPDCPRTVSAPAPVSTIAACYRQSCQTDNSAAVHNIARFLPYECWPECPSVLNDVDMASDHAAVPPDATGTQSVPVDPQHLPTSPVDNDSLPLIAIDGPLIDCSG